MANRLSLFALAVAGYCTVSTQAGDAHFHYFSYVGRSQENLLPKQEEYLNPIISGYAPDPSITRVGGDYFLVNSSFTNYPGLPIYHSKDLVTWRQIGNAISRPDQFDFTDLEVSGGIMAPDISHHGGLFYIVSTCRQNFFMTARYAAGPWSNPVWLNFDGIDPSLFWNDDGKAYIVNNGPPDGPAKYEGHRVLWLQQFDPLSKKMIGPRTALVGGGENPPHIFWPEGPHIFKKDGRYYLIAAAGGTGPDEHHSEIAFRSKSLFGPYEGFSGNPILTQADLPLNRPNPVEAAGHADFITTNAGDWWAVFLGARSYAPTYYNIGRETYLLPVTWTNDGWPIILKQTSSIPLVVRRPHIAEAKPAGYPQNGNFGYFTSFKEKRLPLGWTGIRTTYQSFYRLREGDLILPAGNALGNTAVAPAFIGRKQAHAIAEIITSITYIPDSNDARAGLVALQSDNTYLFFGVTCRNGQLAVTLMERETADDPRAGRVISTTAVPINTHDVRLKLNITGGSLSASFALGQNNWTILKTGLDATFLSTKRAKGFTGTVIGLYNESSRRGQ